MAISKASIPRRGSCKSQQEALLELILQKNKRDRLLIAYEFRSKTIELQFDKKKVPVEEPEELEEPEEAES